MNAAQSMPRYGRWAFANLDVVYHSDPVEWYARCPFNENHRHGDRSPSFGINVQKGVYFCHGCKQQGHFKELAKKLRVRLVETPPTVDGITSKINRLKADHGEEVRIYPEAWLAQFINVKGRSYWRKRGLSDETIEEFGLGYDHRTNSATVPIRDIHGRVLGVIRRQLGSNVSVRYVYPKGFKISEQLWGAYNVHGDVRVAITEGSVDSLACWDAHIPSVALLGSRLSRHQAHLIQRLGIKEAVIMTDRDEAGIAAAKQVKSALNGVLVSLGTYRESWLGNDPAELTFSQRREMFLNATLISV